MNGTENQWKYQGKEHQEELGLDWYDFQARNYDPALGRWMNIDPLAESSRRWTPYNFAYNNPIYFVDPDGMQAVDWFENADGIIEYDENIKSQADLDKAGIEGEYIAESFTAKDQNGDIFVFNDDGSVTDSDATVSMMEAGGVDTSGMTEVTSSVVEEGIDVPQSQNNVAVMGLTLTLGTAGTDLVTPDPSDLAAVPKAIGYVAAIIGSAIAIPLLAESDITMSFAKTKAGKAAEVEGAEHTSGARQSTKGKHQKGQTRKQQKNRDKKRNKPGWKQH